MLQAGFVGLGSQGGPMAQRLIDGGFDVALWARNPATLEPFAESGARFTDSLYALGETVDIVGVCVVDDAGVREVCNELIPAMRAGACLLIHSTVQPDLCVELAQRSAERGISLLDAPVSGGGVGAANGSLTVMVGGEAAALQQATPFLEAFSGLIVHLGGVGAGQRAKIVNNSMMAAHVAIAHIGIQAASQLGIERDAFVKLVAASSGRSFGFDVYARQASIEAFSHGASLLNKDLNLLKNELAESEGTGCNAEPFFALTEDFMRQALPKGHAET